MSPFDSLAEKVRTGERLPFPLSALLTSATPLTRVGMWWRLRQPRVRVEAHVISFGNITAGGTGKTPAVIERAQREIAAGRKVAVLTRGYGADHGPAGLIVVEGREATRMWRAVGDEAALIGRKAPEVFIARSADRVGAARAAIDRYGCDVLILDDGFQYVRLERDENVAVIDAANPFGNRRLLPRGILREPISALSRATHLVLTRCDQSVDCAAVVEELRRTCPHAPVRKTRHAPVGLWRVRDGETRDLSELRNRRLAAACAIGNPNAFVSTLQSLGADVVDHRFFRDHTSIPTEALTGDDWILTTEKDAIRMESPPDNVFALAIELADY